MYTVNRWLFHKVENDDNFTLLSVEIAHITFCIQANLKAKLKII